MGNPRYRDGFDVTLHWDQLDVPVRWQRPRLVFVNSMSDMFHDLIPLTFLQRAFAAMADARQHVFQILTKRPERLVELAPYLSWPANVWMGVSIESQEYVWRLDLLRQVPAAVRFLSLEPLLGPITSIDLAGMHWVIVGGESGPGHRPVDGDWIRRLRDMCNNSEVPFFFKQWGGRTPKAGGRLLDGRTWDGMPRFSEVTLPESARGQEATDPLAPRAAH
jgi:protein gp37